MENDGQPDLGNSGCPICMQPTFKMGADKLSAPEAIAAWESAKKVEKSAQKCPKISKHAKFFLVDKYP